MQLPYSVRTLGYRLLAPFSVRIRSGVNRGYRWSLASTGRGYGSGRFGRDRLGTLAALVCRGGCFWDLGAHKGFMTLAASRLVGPTGRVVSIEPGRANLAFLRRHVRWNDTANVVIVPMAIDERAGRVAFGGRGDTLAYQVGLGDELVEAETVPGIMKRYDVPAPTFVKMDIEGREAHALRGALPVLPDDAGLLISVHGPELLEEVRTILGGRDFRLYESAELALRPSGRRTTWGGDHDLLALGPARAHEPAEIHALDLIRDEG